MLYRDRNGNIVEVPTSGGGYYKTLPQPQQKQPSQIGQVVKPLGSALIGAGLKGLGGGSAAASTGGATTAGTASAAGAAAGAAAEGGSLLGGVGLGGIAAGGYTGYQQIKGAQNALKGKDMSMPEKVALALPTFGTSLVWDNLKDGAGVFGGKSKEQQARDKVRENLQQLGFFGENKDDWTLDNPDGTGFDVGKDGGARYNDRRYYELDMNSPNALQGDAIGAVNPLGYLITGGNEKLATQFAGYFTNTIMQGDGANNSDILISNALDKYKKAGFDTPEKAHAGIDDLVKAGKLDPEKAAAFHNGINAVFGSIPKQTSSSAMRNINNQVSRRSGVDRRRRSSNVYQAQTYAPNVYSPTTTAPIGSSSQFGDGFAQSLANVYLANQGL